MNRFEIHCDMFGRDVKSFICGPDVETISFMMQDIVSHYPKSVYKSCKMIPCPNDCEGCMESADIYSKYGPDVYVSLPFISFDDFMKDK